MRLAKPLLAGFLVFIGAGAVTVLAPDETVAIALAHGFVIMTFAYAFGNDGGSYINPASAVAAVVACEYSVLDAIPVIVVQVLGGIAGAMLLAVVYGHGAPHHLGATLIDLDRTTLFGRFILEAVGTFFLANAVLDTAIRGTAGRFAPFAILRGRGGRAPLPVRLEGGGGHSRNRRGGTASAGLSVRGPTR